MAQIEENARFDFIRYANCWEDADILLRALSIKPGEKCLSICSAGDNSLSMLVHKPEIVIAIDLNPSQLACLELRKAAFKELEYEDMLEFLGVYQNSNRTKTYELIKSNLSNNSREFWDENITKIENGVIYEGKFENYFRIFNRYLIPLMHRKKTLEKLVSIKSIEEQIHFYDKKWNNINWRMLFKIFFGRYTMGRLGRDPEFFKYVEDDVASSILKRTKHAFTLIPTYSNPYLNFIMTGKFKPHALPFYLRKENFITIKENINHIKPVLGNIKSCMKDDIKFDAFNLSDIFEYMNMSEFREELSNIISLATKNARIAYWNMLSDRIIPDDIPITIDSELSERLFYQDKAWFYKRFIVGINNHKG
ncbi:S-adenosylmethionine:diacylglycerol 3-amino-3-carboxypropyl transferase [Candidatus Magnetomorum sp. HK-1]|nr:S-adenosylmethionine:diacylglycerol 3-amino-3-carboxypropyl transferase [Candidatus Magnetomorum sp. HK-1]